MGEELEFDWRRGQELHDLAFCGWRMQVGWLRASGVHVLQWVESPTTLHKHMFRLQETLVKCTQDYMVL